MHPNNTPPTPPIAVVVDDRDVNDLPLDADAQVVAVDEYRTVLDAVVVWCQVTDRHAPTGKRHTMLAVAQIGLVSA